MKIGGLLPFSLCEFPGLASAVVFTQGCNFRCPFCHNGVLIPRDAEPEALVPEGQLIRFLKTRRGQLDGVVISGGEPTLQPKLANWLKRIKTMGFRVKLDTNGSQPVILRQVLRCQLVDFIAMDIKAPAYAYDKLTGICAPADAVLESIKLVAHSGLPHQFRTTVAGSLLCADDLDAVRRMVPAGSPHRFQAFRRENALDPVLRCEESRSNDGNPMRLRTGGGGEQMANDE